MCWQLEVRIFLDGRKSGGVICGLENIVSDCSIRSLEGLCKHSQWANGEKWAMDNQRENHSPCISYTWSTEGVFMGKELSSLYIF